MDTRGNTLFGIFDGYTRFKELEYDTNKTLNKPLENENDKYDCLNETSKTNKSLIRNDTNFTDGNIEELKDKIVNLENQLTTMQLALVEEYERNLAFKDIIIMQLYRDKSIPTIIKLSNLECATVYADLIRKGIKNISDIPDDKDLRANINDILEQD